MADATLERSGVSHAAPDAALLKRFAAKRDAAAFAELVRRHSRLVWGVCRRRLARPEDAEDAFQATFLALAGRAASIRKAEALPGWLHSTACRAAVRVASVPPRELRRDRPAAGLDVVAELVRLEEVVAVDEEIVRLPDRYRAPIVLFHLEGLDRREVANRLGLTEANVKTRLRRGRLLLRARLVRRGVVLPALLPFVAGPVPAVVVAAAGRIALSLGPAGLPAVTSAASAAKVTAPAVSWAGGTSAATAATLAGVVGVSLLLTPGDPAGRRDVAEGRAPVIEIVLPPGEVRVAGGFIEITTPPPRAGGRPGVAGRVAAAKLRAELNQFTTLKFPNTPLPDALDIVGAMHEIKVEIDRPALEAAGVLGGNNDATVTLAGTKVRLRTALDRMLRPLGLTYVVQGETLLVTTPVNLAQGAGAQTGREG